MVSMRTETVSELSSNGKSAPHDSARYRPGNLRSCHGLKLDFHDPLQDDGWDRLVKVHPEGNAFHGAAWARVLHRTYGHRPVYLRCSLRGETAALIPLMEVRSPLTGCRGVSLPFSDFCEPLLSDGVDPGLIVEQVIELAHQRNWRHLEIRGRRVAPTAARPAVAFHGHSLDLRQSPRELLSSFAGSVRRAIRKAEREGLDIRVRNSRKAMTDFFQLHARTRRRHGLPPQPLSFFLNIHEEIIELGQGFIVHASRGLRPVAAAVFFHLRKNAVYKFGASDETLQEFRGNNLVMWEGIRHLAKQGAERLHFGRTSLRDEGLRRFKLAWGAQEEKIEYFKFDTAAKTWVTGVENAPRIYQAVFRRMPLALNRLAGRMIYPHLD